MAQIETLYAENLSQVDSVGSTKTQVVSISGASIAANSTWLILAVASIRSSSAVAGDTYQFYLTADNTLKVSALAQRSTAGEWCDKLQYSTVHTFGDVPGSVFFEVQDVDGDSTVSSDSARIFMIRLDADFIEGTDWSYSNPAVIAMTTSYADLASTTLTMQNAGDALVLSMVGHNTNVDTVSNRLTLNGATTGTDAMPEVARTISNNGFRYYSVLSQIYSLSAGQHTFTVQGKASGTSASWLAPNIFVLDLTKFTDKTISTFTSGATDITAIDTFQEAAAASITPSVTGEFVTFGFVRHEALTVSDMRTRVQIDAVTTPTGDDTNVGGLYGYSSSDKLGMLFFARHASLTASTLYDIDCDVSAGETGSDFSQHQAMTMGMELSSSSFKSYSGLAKHAGRPTSGATIVAYRDAAPFDKIAETTSGADGTWSFSQLPVSGNIVIVQKGPDGFNDQILANIVPQ